jgi:cysteine desulfurase
MICIRRVYLDHAATTPVRPEVADIMVRYMVEKFGNPSSIHSFGREARQAVDDARDKIAEFIGAEPREIIFTSGGTEADNLALKGVLEANPSKGRHIITSQIEHHAILHTCEYLEKRGYSVTYLPVDSYGMVSPEDVASAFRNDTAVVSIMMANNEVGTIQPVEKIGRICREKGVPFHTDSVQALGQIPVNVGKLGIDMMSVSSHKIYGPKGIGVLYLRRGIRVTPLAHGGVHERGLRAGTENIPGIVGFGKACELAMAEFDQRVTHYEAVRDRLMDGILTTIPHSRLNGHRTVRLPNNCNVSILYVEGESMLLNLDMNGIAASSGSACTSGSLEPSHVLMAMGVKHEEAQGSLRFTVGTGTTIDDIDYVLSVLPRIVERLRAMSPLTGQPWGEGDGV